MASASVRDQIPNHLITQQSAALVLIDYQPSQLATVRSMDADLLRKNIVSTVKATRAFGVPIVHSTVNVASGQQQPTVPGVTPEGRSAEPWRRYRSVAVDSMFATELDNGA